MKTIKLHSFLLVLFASAIAGCGSTPPSTNLAEQKPTSAEIEPQEEQQDSEGIKSFYMYQESENALLGEKMSFVWRGEFSVSSDGSITGSGTGEFIGVLSDYVPGTDCYNVFYVSEGEFDFTLSGTTSEQGDFLLHFDPVSRAHQFTSTTSDDCKLSSDVEIGLVRTHIDLLLRQGLGQLDLVPQAIAVSPTTGNLVKPCCPSFQFPLKLNLEIFVGTEGIDNFTLLPILPKEVEYEVPEGF